MVIGRRCRHVKKEDARAVIAGYACYNEGSVREWQRHSAQFTPGKNFFHSGGFGPWLVTPEEVGDITEAHLITRLNGQEVQHATIDDLCFDIPTLIEYVSTFTQLEAGDVIVTGTTGGVGAYRKPPLWMKPGDTVEVEITGVGTAAQQGCGRGADARRNTLGDRPRRHGGRVRTTSRRCTTAPAQSVSPPWPAGPHASR